MLEKSEQPFVEELVPLLLVQRQIGLLQEALQHFTKNSHPSEKLDLSDKRPEDYKEIKTLGDLLTINYKLVGVKEQLKLNLISLITKK